MAYNNPTGLIVMSVFFQLLVTGAVALRLLSRKKARAGFWVDDWLIVVALLCATLLTANELYGVAVNILGRSFSGSFRDAQGYLNTHGKRLVRIQFVSYFVTNSGLACIKLSIAFLYYRIFNKHKVFRIISIIWIVIIAIWGAVFVAEVAFECGTGLHYYFNGPKKLSNYYCRYSTIGDEIMIVSDAATDLIMYLLPLPMIARLNTTLLHKLQVMGVFAIGAFSIAVSALRAAYYINAALDKTDPDFQLRITKLTLWAYFEVVVGILVACAITMRPLFVNWKLSSDITSLVARPYRGLRSSFASSRSFSKEGKSSVASNTSSTIDNTNDLTSSKVEGTVTIDNASISDVESGDTNTADFSEEKTLSHRQSQSLGHIAVEKSYSVQIEQGDRSSFDNDFSSGVPSHIAPFHHRSTSPRQNLPQHLSGI